MATQEQPPPPRHPRPGAGLKLNLLFSREEPQGFATHIEAAVTFKDGRVFDVFYWAPTENAVRLNVTPAALFIETINQCGYGPYTRGDFVTCGPLPDDASSIPKVHAFLKAETPRSAAEVATWNAEECIEIAMEGADHSILIDINNTGILRDTLTLDQLGEFLVDLQLITVNTSVSDEATEADEKMCDNK